MMSIEKIRMINPKKKLFQWGPIAVRLFYGSIFCEVLWLGTKKEYKWAWPTCLGLYDHERIAFVLEDKILRAVGEKYFKAYFLNRAQYTRQWKRWEEWMQRYDRVAKTLEEMHVTRLSTSEFVAELKDFYEFNKEFWLIVHVPEIANWGGEQMLQKRLERIDRPKAQEYLEILSAPVQYSFFQEEELALLKIAAIKKKKEKRAALQQHATQYRWLLNSYGGNRVLDATFFARKLRDLLREGSATSLIKKIHAIRRRNISRKRVLARQLRLTRQDVFMAEQLAQSIWWQDQRKAYIWRMNYYWDMLLREVARRRQWKFDDILWCWPNEVFRIAAGRRVDKKKIQSRRRYYVNVLSENGMRHIYGSRAKQIIDRYLIRNIEKRQTTVRGLVVSKGDDASVTGRVTIVRNPFVDGKKMKRGDILVASMTSPEFIVVMKKAAAIITDHGGMTSHAAIVSRELGVPCIVGTKSATYAFKTGDRVVVDPQHGTIKKI